MPFTRPTIFKASSYIEVASGETGDSFGDSYTIYVETPACIPSSSNIPVFGCPLGKGNFGNSLFQRLKIIINSAS